MTAGPHPHPHPKNLVRGRRTALGMVAAVAMLTVCVLQPAAAQTTSTATERGTRDEAKALVDAAFEHARKAGSERALKDFSSDRASWVRKDLYVFAFNFQGVNIAHGVNEKIIGKDMLGMTDSSGKAYVAEFVRVAKSTGAGWVDYEFAHPQTRKSEPKTSYIRRLPSGDGLIGVGVYR